jgi:hypothetical protein
MAGEPETWSAGREVEHPGETLVGLLVDQRHTAPELQACDLLGIRIKTAETVAKDETATTEVAKKNGFWHFAY